MKAPKKGGKRRFGTVPGDAELAGAYQTDILSSDGLRQQITVHFESLPLGGSGKTTPPPCGWSHFSQTALRLRTMLSLMMAVTGGPWKRRYHRDVMIGDDVSHVTMLPLQVAVIGAFSAKIRFKMMFVQRVLFPAI